MSRHFEQPPRLQSVICQAAHAVLCQAADACEAFHVIFRNARQSAGPGPASDAEQNILRAMLVFAGAGLDSALKQLVRDALPAVIDSDSDAQDTFTASIKRKLPDIERSRDLLANVLTAKNPRSYLLERVMADLLADSLQSVPQFAKVAATFNIKVLELIDIRVLKQAFDARNQIVHEMDIDFAANRSRRSRRKEDMEQMTAAILQAAAALLTRVDAKLNG